MERYNELESTEEKLARIPPRKVDKSDWPSNIREASLDEYERMAIDCDGNLYWDGKKIQFAQLKLSIWQKTGAATIAVSAAIVALDIIVKWALWLNPAVGQ